MASRPTQGNTKKNYARPGTEPDGPAIEIAPRGARPHAEGDGAVYLSFISVLPRLYRGFISVVSWLYPALTHG